MTLILSVMTKRTVKYFTLVFGIFFYIIANYRPMPEIMVYPTA